jgi:RHS repeat-associated protein
MEQVRIERYFAGTRLNWKADRLGSRDGNGYFPYGEERGSPTTNDTYKFATYRRDQTTGLDYADQRYYASSLGRFLTPDPRSTATSSDPSAWNKYVYVSGDPLNFNDPRGTEGLDVNLWWAGLFSPGEPGGWGCPWGDATFGPCAPIPGPVIPPITVVLIGPSHVPAYSFQGSQVFLNSVDWDAVFSYIATTTTWPLPTTTGWSITVEELLGLLRRFPALLALAASIERTGDAGLPPDPDKCPESFWAADKAPHQGWKWEPPVGNQAGYWYNPKSPGMKLSPHLEWEVNKPPHWDYTDPTWWSMGV